MKKKQKKQNQEVTKGTSSFTNAQIRRNDFLRYNLGNAIIDALQQQQVVYPVEPLRDVDKDKFTLSFPLGEDILGDGLVGTKFYSYTLEVETTGRAGKYKDKNIAPFGKEPKEFVYGLSNVLDAINTTLGYEKKGTVKVDLGVAVPAPHKNNIEGNGYIRYLVVIPQKNFDIKEDVEIDYPQNQPFEQLTSQGLDVFSQKGYTERLGDQINMQKPIGEGGYKDRDDEDDKPQPAPYDYQAQTNYPEYQDYQAQPNPYPQPAPAYDPMENMTPQTAVLDELPDFDLLNISPMGPQNNTTQHNQSNPQPNGQDNPFAKQRPAPEYGFNPYDQH